MIKSNASDKKCVRCNQIKSISQFYRNGRHYSSYCKECLKELSRQRVTDGRDRKSKIKYEEKRNYFRSEHKGHYIPPPPERLTDLQRVSREMYRNAKKRSLISNRGFDLSKEYVEHIVAEFCSNHYHVLTSDKHPFKPSLDRIDSNGGYTADNVVVAWQIENYCKNTFTNDDVIEFCKRKLGLL